MRPKSGVEAFRVLTLRDGTIPHPDAVVEFARRARIERPARRRLNRDHGPRLRRAIRLSSELLIDVTSVSAASPLVGVISAVVDHWSLGAAPTFILWDKSSCRYVEVTPAEVASLGPPIDAHRRPSIAPWGATLLVLGPALDDAHATCLRSIAEFSGSRCVAIGEGCAPVTAPQVDERGVGGAFSKHLSALARFDSIIAVSELAHTEYLGWKRMLGATGLTGPEVNVLHVPLPTRIRDRAPAAYVSGGIPVVAVIGELTARNNALALLQAVETAWQLGLEFDLAIGGQPTEADVASTVAYLHRRGRRILIELERSNAPDDALIREAHFCIYLPNYDSFAAPIMQSLARGIPVVTSNFGRMRELAEGRGGLVVDPRDPDSIGQAIQRLIKNCDARSDLSFEAAQNLAIESTIGYAQSLLHLTLGESPAET